MNPPYPDIVEGVVEKLLPGGEGLFRCPDGRHVLVRNALPGERLTVRIDHRRRGALRGEIARIIDPSPQRVEPPCPVAGACGGCALQFLDVAGHAATKSEWVYSAFRRLIGPDTAWMPIEQAHHAGRRRVRWHAGHDGDGFYLGFHAPLSHRVVRQPGCMVLTDELQALRQQIEVLAPADIEAVQATHLADGIHVVLESPRRPGMDPQGLDVGLPLQCWWRDGRSMQLLTRPARVLHDLLPAGDCDIRLMIGPDGFVQGQFEGNRLLVGQIQAWSGTPRRIADLFCGAGNLSIPLALASGASVAGADLSWSSVQAAGRNAKALGVQAKFSCVNLFEDFDPEPYIAADVLILDAPRRGAKRICTRMQHLMPARIIMVSCDIAAGARDGALLAEQGYRLRSLRALDMFPFAGHVEVLSLWEPA